MCVRESERERGREEREERDREREGVEGGREKESVSERECVRERHR